MDARIGVLNNGTFYAFVNGYSAPETIGTLAEVEIALGLRAVTAAKKVTRIRVYTVTITPKIITWSGSTKLGEYSVSVNAVTDSEAVSLARRDRLDEEGRFGVPATYRARLAN